MSSFSPASPGFKRAQLRAEASAALDSLLPDTNARVIYKAQDSTGRMTTLLSGGAPSVSYEASIGAGKLGKDGVIPPPHDEPHGDQGRGHGGPGGGHHGGH